MLGQFLKNKFIVIGFIVSANFFAASGQSSKFKLRCGWFENPTPANYWFYDKDDEWIFSEQGGYQLEDFEFPKFGKKRWIAGPNGSYGYGCACFEMRVDPESKRVLEVRKSYSRPLSVCRKDMALRQFNED